MLFPVRISIVSLTLALIVSLSGCGKAGSTADLTTWKFAIEEIEGSVQDAYARKFKELIEKKTDGKIQVTVYPYGSLGTSEQLTQLTQNGAVQFAMASPGHLGKMIPEVQVFLLHHVLSADPLINKEVLKHGGAIYEMFEPLYAEKNFQLIGFFPEGWMVWTTDRPVRTPEDMEGLKMRVMSSPLLVETYKAYGANPTPMPYSEVYSGLQLKMIDGQVNPVFAIEEMSFYEVSDYMIFPAQSQFTASVIANKSFYDNLSAETKELISTSVAEIEDYIFEVQRKMNEERLATIQEKKPDIEIIHLDEEERAAFIEKSLPVRDTYIDQAGKGGRAILDELITQTEKIEVEM